MSKERPILFSTAMVEAILNGTKSQTRRTKSLDGINTDENIKWMYKGSSKDFHVPAPAKKFDNSTYYAFEPSNSYRPTWVINCPFGEIGDKIWIREEHKIWTDDDGSWWNCEFKDGVIMSLYYKAIPLDTLERLAKRKTLGKWQRARFLPRVFSRIIAIIEEVRVERLNDISEEDARNEGVSNTENGWPDPQDVVQFQKLWESINGPESWEQNPWVWVISFKTLQPQSVTY
jgi:hypothetical protein